MEPRRIWLLLSDTGLVNGAKWALAQTWEEVSTSLLPKNVAELAIQHQINWACCGVNSVPTQWTRLPQLLWSENHSIVIPIIHNRHAVGGGLRWSLDQSGPQGEPPAKIESEITLLETAKKFGRPLVLETTEGQLYVTNAEVSEPYPHKNILCAQNGIPRRIKS